MPKYRMVYLPRENARWCLSQMHSEVWKTLRKLMRQDVALLANLKITKKSTIFILPKSFLPSHAQRHPSSKLIHTAVKVDLIRQPRYINMQIRDVYRNSLPIGNTSCHRQKNHSEDLALVNWQIPPGYCCPINHGPFGRAAFLNRRSLPFSSGKELSLRGWNKLLYKIWSKYLI